MSQSMCPLTDRGWDQDASASRPLMTIVTDIDFTFTFVMVSTTSVDVMYGLTCPVNLYPTTLGNTMLIA